jgi:hypothetical protein
MMSSQGSGFPGGSYGSPPTAPGLAVRLSVSPSMASSMSSSTHSGPLQHGPLAAPGLRAMAMANSMSVNSSSSGALPEPLQQLAAHSTPGGAAGAAGAAGSGAQVWKDDVHSRPDTFLMFTCGQQQLLRYPVWWYLDPDSHVHGPYGAEKMISWSLMSQLPGSLPVCCTTREFAGAGLAPQVAWFRRLSEVTANVAAGRLCVPHHVLAC